MNWKVKGGVLLASMAMLAAACGSGRSTSSGASRSANGNGATASNSAGATAKLKGTPVKFGLLADMTVAGADSHPDAVKLAQIAAAAINDSGGINGRPLQIVICDSKQDPQTASLCAQQLLIQDKVVAMVGSPETEEGGSLYPALAQANTINFGDYPAAPQDFSSPRSFPLVSGPVPYLLEPGLVPKDAKKVAFIYGMSAPTEAVVNKLAAKLPPNVQSTKVGIPASGVVDMSPYCLQLQQSKADAAIILLSSTVFDQFLSTCQNKGVTGVTYLMTDFNLDNQTLKLFANITPSPIVLLTFSGSAITEMLQQVAKYGKQFGNPQDVRTGLSENSWLSVTLAADILKKLPVISGAAFAAYLNKQTALVTGGTPPLNFTKPGADPAYPRVVNTSIAPGKIQNGSLVQTGSFIGISG